MTFESFEYRDRAVTFWNLLFPMKTFEKLYFTRKTHGILTYVKIAYNCLLYKYQIFYYSSSLINLLNVKAFFLEISLRFYEL